MATNVPDWNEHPVYRTIKPRGAACRLAALRRRRLRLRSGIRHTIASLQSELPPLTFVRLLFNQEKPLKPMQNVAAIVYPAIINSCARGQTSAPDAQRVKSRCALHPRAEVLAANALQNYLRPVLSTPRVCFSTLQKRQTLGSAWHIRRQRPKRTISRRAS